VWGSGWRGVLEGRLAQKLSSVEIREFLVDFLHVPTKKPPVHGWLLSGSRGEGSRGVCMRFCVLIFCRLAKGQRVHIHLLESPVKGQGLEKGGRHVLASTLKINQIKLTQPRPNILHIRQPHKLIFFSLAKIK